ncbi:M48 family metallopeptidase [Acetivibrio cellulolyticus]|uniref:M48 family metallopeptidase n=1 Tax=Acetivibrio cellulolyticus TaxID=35830 RepID=UPI0002D3F985|nr:SprT family zinc-dependent metalloprotease [Acetivibrio cellulolyticus]
MEQIKFGDIVIEVEQKDIKNIHLSVYPPSGAVRIAAPLKLDMDTIRVYALSKLTWIRKQQEKFRNQVREAPREYLNRESHFFRGKRYLLKVVETDAPPRIELKHKTMVLCVRAETPMEKRQIIIDEWYRAQLKELIPQLIEKWEKVIKVKVNDFGIRRMKTKWGTCNIDVGRIWINLELAKKPPQCLEYIVVHEMVHLLERKHNNIFIAHMDKFLPKWKFYKDELNQLPVRHEKWKY